MVLTLGSTLEPVASKKPDFRNSYNYDQQIDKTRREIKVKSEAAIAYQQHGR
jgi:hypothetical protein